MVESPRPPERAFLHGLATLLGVGYLTVVPAPGSVAAVLPHWLVLVWAASLLASGLIGLWTFAMLAGRKPLTARLYGRVAVRLQSGGVLILLIAVVGVWYETPHRPTFPYLGVLLFAGWLATIVARDRQLASEINRMKGDGRAAMAERVARWRRRGRSLRDGRHALPDPGDEADRGRLGD